MSITSCSKQECLSNRNGFCHSLTDTNFANKPCPFYKTELKKVFIKHELLDKYLKTNRKPTKNKETDEDLTNEED